MASDNKLELIVEVDVNKVNASIKSINTGLGSTKQAAGKTASGACAGIDGFTVSMVKGSAAALYKKLVTANEGYVGDVSIIHQAVAVKAAIDAMDTAFAEDREASS
jgi:hypothetical protein